MVKDVIKGHTDCGLQDTQYRHLMAVLTQTMLRDVSESGEEDESILPRAAMIMPAMKSPFPRVVLRRTRFRPVFVVDPDEDSLTWQRNNTERGAKFIRSEGVAIRYPLRDVALTINPFGLQQYPTWRELYPGIVLKHSCSDARLITLDWGVTRYEEDLADLPGIAHEIEFSWQAQLEAFGTEAGWQLVKDWEYFFHVEHGVSEIAALLSPENADCLRSVVAPDRRVKVGSSVIYRYYQRL